MPPPHHLPLHILKNCAPQPGCLVRNRLLGPVASVFAGIVLMLAFAALSPFYPALDAYRSWGELAAGLSALAGIVLVVARINRHLVRPLRNVRIWAQHMRRGELSAKMVVPAKGECIQLAKDINSLGEQFRLLNLEMENQVQLKTRELEDKTRELQLLYDVVAGVNLSRDLDELLSCYLLTLMEVVHADAGTVRLLTEDGRMRLVAQIGFDELESRENPETDGEDKAPEEDRQEDEAMDMQAVPLQYRGKTLGVYNLFGPREAMRARGHSQALLATVGRHLGMAIDKALLDREAARLSLMEERAQIAHELHDSLAQTLASMRFQTRLMDDATERGDRRGYDKQLGNLKNTLDEAYSELREIIGHFRAPLDRRGLIPALTNIIDRFKQQTGIHVLFQNLCEGLDLSASAEVQVLRIVQESLANIRKHADAHFVRILLRCDPEAREYHLLIEDDGVGFEQTEQENDEGNHIGLSIMEQRARRLDGRVRIESEPGEGARVLLDFPRRESKPADFDVLAADERP